MYTAVSNTSTQRFIERNPALPRRGQIYTLREILTLLELHDSPSLGVMLDGKRGVIQDAHLTEEQMLGVPGMADTKWRYAYTTDEWIPVFDYVGPIAQLRACLDYEPDFNHDGLWVTPKGFPRKQYVHGAW